MNFSENTLSILKNFASINPSIILKPGNVIKTLSPQKTIMAEATIAETIKVPAAIYDVSRFLATLSLFENPDVDFQEKKFTITSGRSRVNYTYAAEAMIIAPPEKGILIPDPEVTVVIQWDDIQKVIRASSVLQLSEIAFRGDGESIYLAAIDSKNPTADIFEIAIGETTLNFNAILKVENIKLMPKDYEVSISSKGMAYFKGENIKYWISVERHSTFN